MVFQCVRVYVCVCVCVCVWGGGGGGGGGGATFMAQVRGFIPKTKHTHEIQ